MAMSIVVPRAAPINAVSLVTVTNTIGSFSTESCYLINTEVPSSCSLRSQTTWNCAVSLTDKDSTIECDSHEISHQLHHQDSTESLFSLSEETTCSQPSSLDSSLSFSPSLREAYKVKNSHSLGFKSTQSESATSHTSLFQRRKSSISFSGTLSPTEYHPLNHEFQLDTEKDEYSSIISVRTKHIANVQQKNKPLFLASKFISFVKSMSASVKVPVEFNSEIITHFDNAKRPKLLETFSQENEKLPLCHQNVVIDDPNPDTLLPLRFLGKTNRVREQRFNSNYLLIYALDRSFEKYLSQVEECEINIFDQLLLENYNQLTNKCSEIIPSDSVFDVKFKWKLLSILQLHNDSKTYDEDFIKLLKLASIARYKLWSAITLPPRSDELPNITNLTKNVVPPASLEFCEVPWLSLDDLKRGKAIKKVSSSAGFLRNSNIQFVFKNSCSKRWRSYVNSN